jgi:hypothetical protein
LTAESLEERIEHVASGQAITLTSLEEARAFLKAVMSRLE